MMQREDSKRTQELANASRDIAENTMNDNKELRNLATDSKKITQTIMLDSSAMKTIAVVTMIFSPWDGNRSKYTLFLQLSHSAR